MSRWNSKKIAKKAERNFEKAWEETAELLPQPSPAEHRYRDEGRPHPLFETLHRLRKVYLELGFEEVINPLFVEEKEVRRQFGPEAPAVLDRCYYLAGLPRPDVGLSEEKLNQISSYGVEVGKEQLQELLHSYKRGELDGDELIEKLSKTLKTTSSNATRILSQVFPEFSSLNPQPTRMTLRSHMTSGWFLTLGSLYGKKKLPLKLFSIDRCFRREQVEDSSHLRTHHSASCVVMAEDASVEDGKFIARELLKNFGFERFEFRPDEKRSKYYAPGTQTEVYAYHPGEGWVEVATFGIYSPVALSRYRIEVPVMNLGLGVERLAMILSRERDIREIVYPQIYREWKLSDKEIASMLYFRHSPESREGLELAAGVEGVARKEAEREAPLEVKAFSGNFRGKNLEVKIVEEEEGKRLLGPAHKNQIFIKDGNVKGAEKCPGALGTGISYLRACALAVGARAEEMVGRGEEEARVRFGMVRGLGDVNLQLDQVARNYISTYEKSIDVRGPLFFTAHLKVKKC